MYSPNYFNFISRLHFEKKHHATLEKLSALIPENGILDTPVSELAKQLETAEETVTFILDKLTKIKIPLAEKKENHYVFDYDPQKIEKAAHVQAAMSNSKFKP